MAQNDIEDMLAHLRRIKNGGYLNSIKIDQIETLEMETRFLRTFIKYHHVLLPDSFIKITKKAELVGDMLHSILGGDTDDKTNLNVKRLVSQLLKSVEGNINFELSGSSLKEYMDYLDKNLIDAPKYLSKFEPSSRIEIKVLQENRFLKQVKVVQKKMRFLRYLYDREINGYVDNEKLEGLETRFQFVADNVGQFCLAIWVNEMDGNDTVDIKSKPPYLLCLIALVKLEMQKIFLDERKASKFSQSRTFKDKKLPKGLTHHLHRLLLYLRNKKLKNFPTNVPTQDIDVAIEFLLVFLGDVPNCVINGKRLNEVLEKVGALVGYILWVIQMLLVRSTINDDTRKNNFDKIHILEKVEDLKAQVEGKYYTSLKFTPSQFPAVGGLSFLDSLLRKLNEMLKSQSSLDFIMKPNISILEKELSSLTSIFRCVAEVHQEHETFKNLQRHTINLAYEVEVAIDSILVRHNALFNLFCSLPTIIKEIKHISGEVTEMWSKNLALKPCSMVKPSKRQSTQHSNHVIDEEIVGFEDDRKRLIQHLVGGTNLLDAIVIVGMGGQGKTTCARKLYNNDIIISHFDVRVWCIISQTYYRSKLLREIFRQVTGSKDNVYKEDELADKLRKRLMGRRYLIVLDDMWEVMAWDDLRLSFPDDENGSRVLVTTRLKNVGDQLKHHTNPYFLPFLTLEESCKLLQKKVFQKEGCPHELSDVSLAVAKRCKGLPLVVVLVAGIIKKKKMEAPWWHKVENALFAYLGESEEYSLATMQLSYDNLPDHLRPCLLYTAMFPEDTRIPVPKLINLWITEGFVETIESGRLEEEAEGYLMDLINNNLLMVSGRRYNGKVKYCQVHDVVVHFCLERSREEKFISVMKGNSSQFEPLDWKENRLCYHISDELSEFVLLDSKKRKPFDQHLRSLITHGTLSGFGYKGSGFESHQIVKLRLLKVLDMASGTVGYLSLATLNPLIHLKYLAVVVRRFSFPAESHLPHLETLIVLGSDVSISFPDTFWKMEKLRHVEVCSFQFSFRYLENNKQVFEELSKLDNLRILRGVAFSPNDANCMDELLRRCPKLEELGIFLLTGFGSRDIWNPKLERATQLQSFSLTSFNGITVSEIYLPSNIKKLKFHGVGITRKAVSMIAKLPSLEYLRLELSAFEQEERGLREKSEFKQEKRCPGAGRMKLQIANAMGPDYALRLRQTRIQLEEWCLGDITFHELKRLKLVESSFSRWDASEESFPQLETLALLKCHKLEEIPLSFADIQTLKQISLVRCKNESLMESAVKIKEEVEDIQGSNRLNLITVVEARF